ncbi:MAG: tail fiber domain-containing protein [Acidobacteriota bacterium]|nr:tail fiber domain-containing protein [Acidobacteriota bacterium]
MSFFKGGATSTEQNQLNQNKNYIYGQGSTLNQQAQDRSNTAYDQSQNYTAQADQAYAPLVAGQGGYTADQASAIQDKSGLDSLQLTPQEQASIAGNPTAGMTTGDQLSSNYLDQGEAESIKGDQSGINAGLGQVNAAVDPTSVATYTQNTRLTPEMQDQMATDASRSATNVDRATEDANAEKARASGADPLGVAGYTAQADRAAQQDAAIAASNARVNASNTAASRETNILGANQTLDQQKAAAANTNLSAQQQMEANQSSRAQSMALNRQQTGESNQATAYNQAQTADQTASSRAAGIAQNRQSTGQYVDTANSGRATTVANQEQGQAAEGRQYLSNQIGGTTGAAETQQGIQSGVYGTTTGAATQNTSNQVNADKRQSGFNQFLTAAGEAAQGAAAMGAKTSDFRLKENIVLLGQLNGLNIYEYSFNGNPEREVGVMAQEAYERFPEDVIVGGEDPAVAPWMVRYGTLLPKLIAERS